ncbi:MAG: hypothetical protein P4M12_11115 [Gammaproteobacteria bacterium]|nr:hypothetical protein [Gammaproteobacteria bacterium]
MFSNKLSPIEWFKTFTRDKKISQQTEAPAASTPSNDNSAVENQFAIWSTEDKEALSKLGLDKSHQEMLTTLITTFDEWIHLHPQGWYHSQKTLLNNLLSPVAEHVDRMNNQIISAENDEKQELLKIKSKLIEDNKVLIEVQEGLTKYLQTAFNLRKPKKIQTEKIQSKQNIAHGYRYFWHQCSYSIFHSYLVKISKMTKQELLDGKAKLYIYALLKLKEKELISLELPLDEIKKLLSEFNTVITTLKSKCELDDSIVLTIDEIYSTSNITHEIMPKYHRLLDLKHEFESSPLYTQYAHIRPGILIQFTQYLDYVFKQLEKSAKENKLFHKSNFLTDQSKANTLFDILNKKRKEIATVMSFQERLALSFGGNDDIIEILHRFVENKATRLLPTHLFFNYEVSQDFKVFSCSDLNSTIPASDYSAWRRQYISKHGDKSLHEITPLQQFSVTDWLEEQALIEKNAKLFHQNNIIPVQMIRIVSAKNLNNPNDLENTELKISKFLLPNCVVPYIHQSTQSKAASAYYDQLVGNGFTSNINNKNNLIYEFFITQSEERKSFMVINTVLKSAQLNFMLRQVNAEVDLSVLFSDKTHTLFAGPQGAKNNFLYLTNTLNKLIPSCKNEIYTATKAMEKSENSSHVLAFRDYIKLATQANNELSSKVKTILSYWIEQTKNNNSLSCSQMTEFKTLLNDALLAFDDYTLLAEVLTPPKMQPVKM